VLVELDPGMLGREVDLDNAELRKGFLTVGGQG